MALTDSSSVLKSTRLCPLTDVIDCLEDQMYKYHDDELRARLREFCRALSMAKTVRETDVGTLLHYFEQYLGGEPLSHVIESLELSHKSEYCINLYQSVRVFPVVSASILSHV